MLSTSQIVALRQVEPTQYAWPLEVCVASRGHWARRFCGAVRAGRPRLRTSEGIIDITTGRGYAPSWVRLPIFCSNQLGPSLLARADEVIEEGPTTSEFGTKRTSRAGLAMSVDGGRLEVVGPCPERPINR